MKTAKNPNVDPGGRPADPSVPRPVILVGLMGAGKSCVGRKLAEALAIPFRDSDIEVEKAAGCTVGDIFDVYGEPAFRDCERRVIRRLLTEGPCVLATGGGAFLDPETRQAIKDTGVSVWLSADPEVLYQRTKRSKNRPLLKTEDPLATLKTLAAQRYPTYGEADIVVETDTEALETTVKNVLDAVEHRLNQNTQT